MTVKHVLLIPAPGDPGGLLREGPCGARPPVVTEWHKFVPGNPPTRSGETAWAHCWDETGWWACAEGRSAIVLAWDGEPVPEGCDRASRALPWSWASGRVGNPGEPRRDYTRDRAVLLAHACEAAGLGTAVIVED